MLVPCIVGEVNVVFMEGVGFGPFKGFRSPGVNYLCNSLMGDKRECSLLNGSFHMGSPLKEAGFVSMVIMEVRKGVVNNRIDKSVFDGIMTGRDPCVHLIRELTEFVIDDCMVGGFDVLSTG